MKNRRGSDPRTMDARYSGLCANCGQPFPRGERILYYPATRHALGDACGCAEPARLEFRAAVADERMAG